MKIKRIITLTALAFAFSNTLFSQVGIGTITPDPSAELDVTSTSKGFLLPRMTTTDRGLISSPAKGLMIFNTTTSTIEVNVGTPTTPNWQATSGGSLPAGTSGQTLRHNGTTWVANSTVFNDGTNVGVGTASPLSNLDIQGSMGLKFTTITAATTLNQTHNVVLCNSGPYTVTLPAATTNAGKVYYIKNISSTNVAITLDGNASETIDGSTTFDLGSYKHAVRIICDGSNWHVLENSGSKMTTSTFTTINCDGSSMVISDVMYPATGKIWMDRNLGASSANSVGDMYQWGRLKDGHQCRNSSTTATQSSGDVPGNALFITNVTYPSDWRSTQNNNLWQGLNGINNPCPSGYRIPTYVELINHAQSGWQGGVWPYSGIRNTNGSIDNVGNIGRYWSSTISGNEAAVLHFENGGNSGYQQLYERGRGHAVRCIKD